MLARIRKSAEEKDQGFTLIELLVVIIIIGILAAIAIPVFLNQRKKATEAGMKSDLRTVANEMETYYTDSQAYPAAITPATNAPVIGAATVKLSDPKTKIAVEVAGETYCAKAENEKIAAAGTVVWVYDNDAGGLRKDNDCNPLN